MRNLMYGVVVAVALTAGSQLAVASPPTTWVAYLCDYYDQNTDVTYYGCHHISFSNLDGSVVEILD